MCGGKDQVRVGELGLVRLSGQCGPSLGNARPRDPLLSNMGQCKSHR